MYRIFFFFIFLFSSHFTIASEGVLNPKEENPAIVRCITKEHEEVFREFDFPRRNRDGFMNFINSYPSWKRNFEYWADSNNLKLPDEIEYSFQNLINTFLNSNVMEVVIALFPSEDKIASAIKIEKLGRPNLFEISIKTNEDYRRRGWANTLLSFLMKRLYPIFPDQTNFCVEIDMQNTASLELFHQLGFEPAYLSIREKGRSFEKTVTSLLNLDSELDDYFLRNLYESIIKFKINPSDEGYLRIPAHPSLLLTVEQCNIYKEWKEQLKIQSRAPPSLQKTFRKNNSEDEESHLKKEMSEEDKIIQKVSTSRSFLVQSSALEELEILYPAETIKKLVDFSAFTENLKNELKDLKENKFGIYSQKFQDDQISEWSTIAKKYDLDIAF